MQNHIGLVRAPDKTQTTRLRIMNRATPVEEGIFPAKSVDFAAKEIRNQN